MIDDARGRQARQRRLVVATFAVALAVAVVAYAMIGGGGGSRTGVASVGHASAPPTLSASRTFVAVLRDCAAGSDPLRGSYPQAALRRALRFVESPDPLQYAYSTCVDAISRAIHN
ncbi:MAG TPA: hypothetical protein VKS25_00285 [Solirubrobacteraceae bacterium]|nr:hypothetical protein [Solirubrobacteraceae bacterium]